MWSWVPAEVVMRYVDEELPWFWRIPVRAGVILSPRLRRRVRGWRRLSTEVAALFHDLECDGRRPGALHGRGPNRSSRGR